MGVATIIMDRRIQLWNPTATQSETGEAALTFTKFADKWAAISYKAGTEKITEDNLEVYASIVFTFRYITGIDEKTRIVFEGANYNIEHMAQLGRRYYWEIEASKPDLQ